MAQFLRVCKSEAYCIIRHHGTQRCQQNYYEILNVSPDASQKEIKQAFIRLSKQLHPDVCGKHSHVEFTKLNEAYSTLGKESTRREYDFNLKYSRYNPSTHTAWNRQYGSQWEYEVRRAGGPWPPPPNVKPSGYFGLIISLLFLGLGMTQIFFMFHSWRVSRLTILQNDRVKMKYQQIRDAAQARHNDQRRTIQDLNSVEDLEEYLAENSKK
ncbi:hypothetical protein DMN91_012045 [Ooceraea biroi]|uniref:DnaJ-like protein subfamily C member n=1 Tax=Ooceraea biroi TaxID=2015173 RepID=A0A026WAZ0_OOCBI|nr:dnaJ homolog subfamily C member 4 [Ooceraea biroi]EZA52846.1 DnaJ-like protein subfamily C member [Ooceraea biroi]RLU16285.1 hypothetical protein DMN91_012045 [Ooceraea biroi]